MNQLMKNKDMSKNGENPLLDFGGFFIFPKICKKFTKSLQLNNMYVL